MMKKRNLFVRGFVFTLSFIMVICFAVANIAWAGNENGRHVRGELLIKSKAGTSKDKMQGILANHGAVTAGEIEQIKVRLIRVPDHALEKVKAALQKNQNISFVEYNYIAEGSAEPNDERYSSQWHLPKISAPDGWDMCTGSDMAPIAIIDSGVDPTHPDLSDKLICGYNFVENNTDTHDVLGHGTAVAGTAAAISNNVAGVAGVAWGNPIMPLVVFNSDNLASYYNVARAITFAADNGIRVINLSLGGPSSSSTMQNAINYAWTKETLIFASAANYATSTPYYPAACEHVVAVSATTLNDTRASFSNYGGWIDIAAPGVSILTTNRGGGYGYWNGTSFSSPIVAGLAGLIISANPDLTNTQVVEIITQNADDLGDPGFDQYFGYGRVNAHASLVATIGTAPEPEPEPDITDPLVSIASPDEGSTVSSSITVSVSATDNVGVETVELYIDGALFGTSATEPHNFYWNTNGLPNGYYELSAIAYDTSGNIGYSNSVTVYVHNQQEQDSTPPVVSITSPANGAHLSKLVKIKVLASDNIGVIRMQLYVDGLLRVDKQASVISWPWNVKKESNGEHIISSKAYDAAGNVGITSITIYK
jgi:Subtilase family/Bacterial Ig domain/Fervidolysin N-terminal prodomain